MRCNEIENRLPAYLENLLSPEDREAITGHLSSCHRCSRAFAGLKRAEALVHGLGEVEPPPFFEQRIMSRVREEAGKKQGILRRLFYPLHIKIPIQALATLLVAVLTFYVYQSGDPEMKAMAPLPAPLTDPGMDRIAADAPGALPPPAAGTKVARVPAGGGDLPETNKPRFVTPPLKEDGKEEGAADSRGRAAIHEEHPPPMKPADPLMAAREREVSPISEGALNRMQDKAGKQDADRQFETLPQEQKAKERTSDAGARGRESVKKTAAPSPSRMTAAAAFGERPVIDMTIRVRDAEVAIREIEARLGRVNARIVERRDRRGMEFLKAEMAARNIAVLLELLEAIGRVDPATAPLVVPEGDVTVNIKIVAHP